jgi:hypothetical protein
MADIAITNGPKLQPLSSEETVRTGFTHIATVEAADINGTAGADGDTVTLTIGTTPEEYVLDRVAAYVETAFVTDGTLTIQMGHSGDVDDFLATAGSLNVKTAGPKREVADISPHASGDTVGSSALTLQLRFLTEAATGAPGDISAGKLHLLLRMIDLDKLVKGAL